MKIHIVGSLDERLLNSVVRTLVAADHAIEEMTEKAIEPGYVEEEDQADTLEALTSIEGYVVASLSKIRLLIERAGKEVSDE